jgi:hypothetical protein
MSNAALSPADKYEEYGLVMESEAFKKEPVWLDESKLLKDYEFPKMVHSCINVIAC